MTTLYSEAFQDFLRARLELSCSLPYKWHPSQPQNGWQKYQSTSTDLSQIQSRLLQLPRELRDEIYKLVLAGCTMVHVSSDSMCYQPPSDPNGGHPEDQDEVVYTNDLYFDRCLESATERQVYACSLQENPNDPFGIAPRSCRFQCGSCQRHEHCTKMRGGKVFETALLQACRQVHGEATAILWKRYVFSFQLQHTLTTFVDQLAPLQRHSLRSLHVSIRLDAKNQAWVWDGYDLMTTLASLPGLQNLHLSLKLLCRGNFEDQLRELRAGSLALWEDELKYFRCRSVKNITVIIEDVRPYDPWKKTTPLKMTLREKNLGDPWTKIQRAEFADALKKKLLSK